MMKRVLLLITACLCAVIGVIGLLVPVIPGILFLLLAAVCISLASDRVHRHMSHSPIYRRWRRRWDASAGLGPFDRVKLAFWLTLEATVRTVRGSS